VLVHVKNLLRLKNRYCSPLLRLPAEVIIHILSFVMEEMQFSYVWKLLFKSCHQIWRIICKTASFWWKVDASLRRNAQVVLMRSNGPSGGYRSPSPMGRIGERGESGCSALLEGPMRPSRTQTLHVRLPRAPLCTTHLHLDLQTASPLPTTPEASRSSGFVRSPGGPSCHRTSYEYVTANSRSLQCHYPGHRTFSLVSWNYTSTLAMSLSTLQKRSFQDPWSFPPAGVLVIGPT